MCVVHCKREKYEVYIGRPSKWGNPFQIGKDGDREEVIEKYKRYLWESIKQGKIKKEDVAELKGKVLGCWCAPKPCHGDILIKAAKWASK